MQNQIQKTYFFYGVKLAKKERNNKIVTVAGVIANNNLQVSTSECSAKDQFTKRKGRMIAEGRAIKKPSVIGILPADTKDYIKTFLSIAKQFVDVPLKKKREAADVAEKMVM